MQATILLTGLERVGQRSILPIYGVGPTSYSQTTGDVILLPAGLYLDTVFGDVESVSGNYFVRGRSSATGTTRATWALHWYYAGTNQSQGVDGVVIASAGTGQTNGTFTVNASAGSATIQITIAGGVLTAVKVLNPGSGYSTAPTFTVAEGGTPGTVTATLGAVGGMEVATGTNLSAELVQFGALGGEF